MTTPPPPSESEERPGEAGGPPTAPAAGGRAAELMAAVRAVESGERAATEFFAEPPPQQARPRARQAGRAAPAAVPSAPSPVPVEVSAGTREVLARGGAPEALAPSVAAALGPQAGEVLEDDPWQLLAVPSVRPEQADAFARALTGGACGPDDPRRGRALAVWLLARAAQHGHTVLEVGTLAQQLASHAVSDAEAAVHAAAEEGLLLVFAPEPTEAPGDEPGGEDAGASEGSASVEPAGPVLVGLERWALAEESLAEAIQRLLSTFPGRGGDGGPDSREKWAEAAAGVVGASARELVEAAASAAVVLHTGGEAAKAEPVALAVAAAGMGLRVCLAAHSESERERHRARLPEGPDATANGENGRPGDAEGAGGDGLPHIATVGGLLSGAEGPERDEEGCYALDLLVVTDSDRLGTETAAALAETLPDGARLVLSGDPQQLGSAGAGQVLADLLGAAVCPRVVSRTPDPGPLGELVSSIGVGELPRVEAPGRELVIVPVRDAGEAVHRTVQLVSDSVPRAVGVPAARTQVITVGREGGAGARALNAALKQRLNPGPGAFDGYDTGDRVLHTPLPGRSVPGTVLGADATGLRLECPGGQVTVPRELLAETVRHGWAITAHQAAGNRWPAVVVVLPGDAGPLLDRRWVSTAVGRGERHVSVVQGLGPELDRVVAERPGTPRSTRLRDLLAAQAR